MASKRIYKKILEATTASVCNEMMLEAVFCNDEEKQEKIERIVANMLAAYENSRIQSNVKYDKSPRAFDNDREYHRARRAFYRKMFDRIYADYNKVLNESIESFNALLKA